jgi:hypothetical protein
VAISTAHDDTLVPCLEFAQVACPVSLLSSADDHPFLPPANSRHTVGTGPPLLTCSSGAHSFIHHRVTSPTLAAKGLIIQLLQYIVCIYLQESVFCVQVVISSVSSPRAAKLGREQWFLHLRSTAVAGFEVGWLSERFRFRRVAPNYCFSLLHLLVLYYYIIRCPPTISIKRDFGIIYIITG